MNARPCDLNPLSKKTCTVGFILLLWGAGLPACNDKNATQEYPEASTLHSQSQKALKESYHFEVSNCSTGLHEFNSADKEELRTKVCNALRDDALNHSCAEEARREFFAQRCTGQKWSVPSRPQVYPHFGFAIENQVRTDLRNLLVADAQVSASLSPDESSVVQLFLQDMRDCGFNHARSKCDEDPGTIDSSGSLFEDEKGKVFLVEVPMKGLSVPAMFAFHLEYDGMNYSSGTVKIYKKLQAYQGQKVSEYLADSAQVTELATISIADDAGRLALDRIQNPENARQLYYHAVLLRALTVAPGVPDRSARIAFSLRKNKTMITESGDAPLQRNFLQLAEETDRKGRTASTLAEGFLPSRDPDLRMIASTYVFEKFPDRDELRTEVVKALDHSDWDVRMRAVSGLAKSAPRFNEQLLLIERVADSDSDVRTAALNAVNAFGLNADHYEAVSTLLDNPNWAVRRDAVGFLGKMDEPRTVTRLIAQLDDSDSDVRAAVNAQLDRKKYGVSVASDFERVLKSPNWNVRRSAVTLLSKVAHDSVTVILIDHLGDPDSDVRAEIVRKLGTRVLTEEMVPAFKRVFTSPYWQVRQIVARLLGQIKSAKSRELLEDQLAIEQDADVQRQIIASISAIRKP